MPRLPVTHVSRRALALAALTAAAVIAPSALPASAAAGGYTIYVCDTSPPNGLPASNDTLVHAFPEQSAFATRGMLSTRAGRRCSPGGGTRGLVTMNYYRRGGTVRKGTRASYAVNAPPATRISQLRWAGSIRRRDCRWALQVYTRGPGAGDAAIANKRAGSNCPAPKRVQSSGLRRLRTIPQAAGATTFVQRVVCRAKRCSNRAPAYVRTTALEVSIADNTAPGVGIVSNTPLAQGAWVNGAQTVNYNAGDNVGVKSVQAIAAGRDAGGADRGCDYRGLAGLVPCPNGPGAVNVNTAKLAEGTQPFALAATDSAGNGGASSAVTVRIDKTAPGAVAVGVSGGEGWRNSNSFDVAWANPDEGDRAPITAAHYRLCPVAGGECQTGQRVGGGIAGIAGLAVPAPGEWTLRMWREDAAGNQEEANASQPVALRYDPDPPQVGFEATSAEDPTKLAAQVSDKTSGLAAGEIEISRQGSGSWQQLPTGIEASRLIARVDDSRLPAGVYQVRAFARDKAANQGTSDKRLDGQPMTIKLPLRIPTTLQAGVAKRRTVTKRVKRHGKRRKVRRRVTVLRPRARLHFGRHVTIAGRLTNADGQPQAQAEVQVYSRSETSPEQLVGTVKTGADGRYGYRALGSGTRTLRFAYRGEARILPAQAEVTLLVPGASSIAVRPHRTRNQRSVRFGGRLRAPFDGKLVELQARLPGHWQTFQTLRTDARGRWRARYRFTGTCGGGTRRYRFRARLPKQAGYPYETGRSHTVTVRVRPTSC